MSVYYFNGAQILAPFTITSNEPMFEVDTVSLKKQRASQDAQRWELSFSVVNVDNPADLLLSSLFNFDQSSTMVMPQLKDVFEATTCTIDPTTVGDKAAGQNSVLLDRTLSFGLVPKGSFVKFSNHDKIYILTADVNMTSNSDVTAAFYPSLVAAVTEDSFMNILSSCVITYFRDISDLRGITFSDGIM
jgi:hypothetical protein